MVMEIRRFHNEDISGICNLINSELGYDVSCEDLKARVLQMQEDKNYVILTAVDEEKVIGFMGLQICLAFEIKGKVMRIIALAVARHSQGQGIGSALIQEAEKYANEKNISTDKDIYVEGEDIWVTAIGDKADWVGIYKEDDKVDAISDGVYHPFIGIP